MNVDAASLARFAAKIESRYGCWIWTGATDKDGYGFFRYQGVQMRAHRFAYLAYIGPIPEGRILDHYICDTPSCVNPNHVRPVTHRENILRGRTGGAINAAKTACLNGHPYDEANTAYRANGARRCRACARDRMRRVRSLTSA